MSNKYHMAFFGAFLCFLAVLFGAFGAHALKGILEVNDKESVYELANRYHFYHGLALMIISRLDLSEKNRRLILGSMLSGMVLFSGSLYVLAIANISLLGAVTPIGGTLLLFSWGLLAKHLYNNTRGV